MMRKNILLTALIFLTMATMNAQTTFHDFTVKDINGNEYPLAQLKGKMVLVVNTASKCGLTPQYDALQALYEKYGGNDFIIIGFPANNFMKQEPGSDEEIAEFCSVNYGVTFPMMSKISVKGKDQHAVYKWLTSKDENGKEDSKVSWNFQKYMINEDGQLVGHFSPRTRPDHEDIVAWITK